MVDIDQIIEELKTWGRQYGILYGGAYIGLMILSMFAKRRQRRALQGLQSLVVLGAFGHAGWRVYQAIKA